MEKKYYRGAEISEHGMQRGYVDYHALAETFDGVLTGEKIFQIGGEWDLIHGTLDPDDEIMQYCIISRGGAIILQEDTDELVWYNDEFDMYLWGITHLGTRWDYVVTNIKITW